MYLKQTTILAAVTMWAMVLSVSSAVPLEMSDDAEDIKRSWMWSRLLGATNRLKTRPGVMAEEERALREFSPRIPLTEQKRQRPAMQSRSGGMSLCLWKVCPAAPWLVSKRDGSDY